VKSFALPGAARNEAGAPGPRRSPGRGRGRLPAAAPAKPFWTVAAAPDECFGSGHPRRRDHRDIVCRAGPDRRLESLLESLTVGGLTVLGLAVIALTVTTLAATRGRASALLEGRSPQAPTPRDPLTGLPTRQGFRAALAETVQRATETISRSGFLPSISTGSARSTTSGATRWGMRCSKRRRAGFARSPKVRPRWRASPETISL
jgi:hypothetical protein